MRQKQKTRRHTSKKNTEAAEVPTKVNDTSAEVSDDAACCIAEIDDVCCIVETQQDEEDDEAKARRLLEELNRKWYSDELTPDEYGDQWDLLYAKYAHTDAFRCVC